MNINFPDLENKKIVVTGALRGIGKSIVETLAKQKAHVIYNYRQGREEAAFELKSKLEEIGAVATPLPFDLKNGPQIKEVLGSFVKENGPVEGLVNNAGISRDQLFLRLKEEELTDVLDTNLKGAILVAQALTRGFLRGKNVSIVNISSIIGLMGNAGQIPYASSKAGLIGFTKSLARELAPKNVRCNAICPGFIETDMTNTLDDQTKEAYLSGIPLNRFGQTEEVANLVCFLLSQASAYITGESIKIDGGLYI